MCHRVGRVSKFNMTVGEGGEEGTGRAWAEAREVLLVIVGRINEVPTSRIKSATETTGWSI